MDSGWSCCTCTEKFDDEEALGVGDDERGEEVELAVELLDMLAWGIIVPSADDVIVLDWNMIVMHAKA